MDGPHSASGTVIIRLPFRMRLRLLFGAPLVITTTVPRAVAIAANAASDVIPTQLRFHVPSIL